MSLIGILFGIAFIALIGKALIDTAWGICLIIWGIGCHTLAALLRLTAYSLRGFRTLRRVAKRLAA